MVLISLSAPERKVTAPIMGTSIRADNTRMVERALDHMVMIKRSPTTVYKYRLSYQKFLGWVGSRPLGKLSTGDLNDYVSRDRDRVLVPSDALLKREIMELRSLFRVLHEQLEMVPRNPAVRLVAPRLDNEAPKPVAADVWRSTWQSGVLSDDEMVALGLAFFCGLRRQEITGLGVDQFVTLPAPLIVGVKRKGGKKQGYRWQSSIQFFIERRPDLGAELFPPALERLLKDRHGAITLLPWADLRRMQYVTRTVHTQPDGFINPDLFNKRLRKILARVGQPEDAFTPHMMRHSFCTNLIEMGVPLPVVSRLAGHASVQVTMRYVETGDDPLGSIMAAPAQSVALAQRGRWGV